MRGSIGPHVGPPLRGAELGSLGAAGEAEEIYIRTRILKRRAGRVTAGPVLAQVRGDEESDNERGVSECINGSAEAEGDDSDDKGIARAHPKWLQLLRAAAAGAMTEMSRAAEDAIVGLVVDDLMGTGSALVDHRCRPLYATRGTDDEGSEEDKLED